MRLTYKLLAGLALFLASAKTGIAQELTRDEVVARYQEAMYPAGLAYETMYAEVEMEMGGNQIPATMWMTANGQMRMEMNFLDTRMIMTVNEQGGWMKANDQPADSMPIELRTQFIGQLESSSPDRWRRFINPETTYEGLDNTQGFSAHLLVVPVVGDLRKYMDEQMANSNVVGAEFSSMYIYLDPIDFRAIYVRIPFEMQRQALTSIVTIKDYSISKGFPVPAEMGVLYEMNGDTKPLIRMRFKKTLINEPMAASLFEKPE